MLIYTCYFSVTTWSLSKWRKHFVEESYKEYSSRGIQQGFNKILKILVFCKG